MKMTALLSKAIRDSYGRLHKRDERLTIMSRLSRADFDSRPLLKVRFEDGSTGIVFSEEVELSCMAQPRTAEAQSAATSL
jgi:hypothetical protein